MTNRTGDHTSKPKENQKQSYTTDGLKYFYFDLSEKGHEVVLPTEDDSSWDQLHDITWDPGRGD